MVLKGAGTLVGAPGRIPALCERGNPGMATAGMGDVLTGAIAGILAQCRDTWLAARVGVLVHAMAGDAAARTGERGASRQRHRPGAAQLRQPLKTPEETEGSAPRLAAARPRSLEQPVMLYLTGDLGAGKTTLVTRIRARLRHHGGGAQPHVHAGERV